MDQTFESSNLNGGFYEMLSYYSVVFLTIQVIIKLLPWIYENIGPIIAGPKLNFCEYGEWALVTGATDGIGKSYAKQLAKQGMNIILISRTQSKLERVATEIEVEFNVRTKVLAIDFTGDLDIYKKIANEIKGFDIGILVNNVGISYDYFEYFLKVPNSDQLFDQIIRCNLHSAVYTSKIVLPQMLEKKKGIIINLSSITGTIPVPLLTVYSASKAFIDKFSDDLSHEYYSQGIIVQSLIPSLIATKMTKLTETNIFVPDSDQYCAAAVKTIGYATHSTGYLPHGIQQKLFQALYPCFLFLKRFVTVQIMRYCRYVSLELHKSYDAKKKMRNK